ncbi:MAG: preprotein translocase subunit SecA [Syntrophaceae bacterium PtaU1.Bin231]|nr:MAG: preprotein translocase subunit SecA [Syntrophaceae bacterium PtaU1.Bin231]HOG18029.1 preprotein translocase subunit SecA [Syntrophales bacterium]
MMREISAWPPADYFIRPERRQRRRTIVDRMVRELTGGAVRAARLLLSSPRGVVEGARRREGELKGQADAVLRERAAVLKRRLRAEGFRTELVAEAFALTREVAGRTVGMRHFDCQLLGGVGLLHGFLVEMDTGEGKTLVATLPAAAAALAGLPVHVVTVNDYLAARDAEWMGAVYRFLGLTVGCVVHGKTPAQRRAAYGCDITYCTNKEIVFDYLRDRLVLGESSDPLRLHGEHLYESRGKNDRLLLRGLHYAIVDEADSVLVDEARTPLILSRRESSGEEHAVAGQALAAAGALDEGVDYRVEYEADHGLKRIVVTDAGRERIRRIAEPLGAAWRGEVRREELVKKALAALRLFHRDEHYLVRDGKVQIIDEFTGRVMPDRSWEGGLHQLIEAKEGCRITEQQETAARISYQRFFMKYLRLSGMTGTAREVRGELWSIYALPFMRIPTNRPAQRRSLPDRIFASADEKWEAVVRRIREIHGTGRPVLVGTRTVSASEHLGALLSAAGLPYQILNAKQDEEEARIVARAGEAGRITIATNMAGRGTDIKLPPNVIEKGGLHVLMTERHEAGRIDRQLAGRCGRQGDPGSYEAYLSLEDPLLENAPSGFWCLAAKWSKKIGCDIWRAPGRRRMFRAQKKLEKAHAGARKRLLKFDDELGDTLSFSGRRS